MRTVEITTTQNVTIEYALAPLRERVGAWLIDLLLVGVTYFVFFFSMLALLGITASDADNWVRFIILMLFVIFFGYHIVAETLNNGQTIGKLAMGIKTVRLDGKAPQWSDLVLRTLMQVVDVIASAGVIAALLVKTTPKAQRLGDLAAGTAVIKIQGMVGRFSLKDIQSIASLGTYQPQYPQVRHLSEQDMIFIKRALARYSEYPNEAHRTVIQDLTGHLMPILGLTAWPPNHVEFLRTLLRDYIVLTR